MQYVCGHCGAVYLTLPVDGCCTRCETRLRAEPDSHETAEHAGEASLPKKTH